MTNPTQPAHRWILVVTLLALAGFTAALSLGRTSADAGGDAPARAEPAAARTFLPGLAPATVGPDLPSLRTIRPSPGTAVQAAGPFDERFALTGLTFDGARVTATATITSDVSDLLEFEALAGLYDSQGQLLGTGRFTYHHAHVAAGEQPSDTPN